MSVAYLSVSPFLDGSLETKVPRYKNCVLMGTSTHSIRESADSFALSQIGVKSPGHSPGFSTRYFFRTRESEETNCSNISRAFRTVREELGTPSLCSCGKKRSSLQARNMIGIINPTRENTMHLFFMATGDIRL